VVTIIVKTVGFADSLLVAFAGVQAGQDLPGEARVVMKLLKVTRVVRVVFE